MITLRLAFKDMLAHRQRSLVGIILFAVPLTLILGLSSIGATMDRETQVKTLFPAYSRVSVDPAWCDTYSGNYCDEDEYKRLNDQPIQKSVEEFAGNTVYPIAAVDATWSFPGGASVTSPGVIVSPAFPDAPKPGTVFISSAVAERSGVGIGDQITVT